MVRYLVSLMLMFWDDVWYPNFIWEFKYDGIYVVKWSRYSVGSEDMMIYLFGCKYRWLVLWGEVGDLQHIICTFLCLLHCNFFHTLTVPYPSPTNSQYTLLISFQSNFFAALDDSDTERKAPTPAVNKKKQAPKKTVVEPSKVEKRP